VAIIELGLGLVSIGRRWGVRDVAPPPAEEAIALIEAAVAAGIRFFDTAPAYGASEDLLGRALRGGGFDASRVTIATKFGEHWNA
jgi:aryl-alcohol dehydrogenase-like predicted oxidoreductase